MGTMVVAVLALMITAMFASPIEGAYGRVGLGLGSLAYCPLMLGYIAFLDTTGTDSVAVRDHLGR